MAVAVFVHLAAVAMIMVPSFVLGVVPAYLLVRTSDVVSILSLLHVPFGAVALALGLWFVVGWRLKGLKGCFSRKRLMQLTMGFWVTALLLGTSLYVVLYWTTLMG